MTHLPAPKPALSIVLVSDYAAGASKGWDDLRSTLAALARQSPPDSVEFLLSESAEHCSSIPPDLKTLLPSLRIVLSEAPSSYALKNRGVAAAGADIVAILDADCRPEADWLDRIGNAFQVYPDAVVVSGRTTYESAGASERILALLSRAYLDPGQAGPTRFISNNNAVWKRSAFLAHPLPEGVGPFAARMQSEALLRTGHRLYFDPLIHTIHEFEGWRMEADIRRNAGYGSVITRIRDRLMPQAWVVSLGPLSIPIFVAGKTWNCWGDCLRCWREYGVRRRELPLALAMAPVLIGMEVPGMWAAFASRELSATSYR